MNEARIRQIVRQFRENGLKLLLEHPQNVRELLQVAGGKFSRMIDFDRLTPIQTTFVERDFRHIESDVVLVAPLRRPKSAKPRKSVLIYILIEHQSQPDRLMPLRMLEYVAQIFKFQTREWARTHRSLAAIQLQPVLPIVFYTGTRRWESVGRLIDLVALGSRFQTVTPSIDPLFVNLPAISPKRLESAGGFFGYVLRLLQERKARPREFQLLLRRVLRYFERQATGERLRWLDLLSYMHALVYHERDPSEREDLDEAIKTSVATDEIRKEMYDMGKTIADELIKVGEHRGLQQGMQQGMRQGMQEGMQEGMQQGARASRRQTLLRQLRKRFGDVPPEIAQIIEATDDSTQLDEWLDRFATARSLEEIGIAH